MFSYHNLPILKIGFIALALPFTLSANGQQLANSYRYNRPVSATSNIASADTVSTVANKTQLTYTPSKAEVAIPNLNPELSMSNTQERRQLMGYLKQSTTDNEVNYNQSRTKFLYTLANVFTKLRLYPLAMKTFLKTTAVKGDKHTDSLYQNTDNGYLTVSTLDDSLVAKQVALAAKPDFNKKKSNATTYQYISNTLNDGKPAAAYAMLFHVKQPVPGKRKVHVWGNTGHTFITLIKYNVDSTYSSFSFGFYPKKRNPLSATPLVPVTSSVFKDDTEHQWDEVLGKFISKRRFDKILQLTKQYDKLEYHLSNNNCTDFSIKAAQLAGINIDGTSGKWPLGEGNNPAATGQSILEGKIINTDTGKADGVFVNTVVIP